MSNEFPAWRYGPGTEGEKIDNKPAFEHEGKWIVKKLCASEEDVPAGFVDSPEKVGGEAPKRRGRPPKQPETQTDIEDGNGE